MKRLQPMDKYKILKKQLLSLIEANLSDHPDESEQLKKKSWRSGQI